MTFTSVLLTIAILVIIPALIGSAFSLSNRGVVCEGIEKVQGVKRVLGIIMWSWLFGQLLLWCLFQIIAVWEVVNKRRFTRIVIEYTAVIIVLCVVAVVVNIVRYVRGRGIKIVTAGSSSARAVNASEVSEKKDYLTMVVWVVFAVLLVAQVVCQIVFAYMDVDDSFYVSEAVSINSSNNMYNLIPYTGLTTEMDFRHSLEPFPVWLAYISRISGMNVTVMAHVMLPAVILPLTYGTYALMGRRVLGEKEKSLPIYLVVMELLVIFCLYSTKSPEKFFVTRIRQGKSTLASLIIPGVVFCLFLILDYARKKEKTDIRVWLLLFMLNTAGCLCSTLGALLCIIPVAVVAIMMIFAYKKGWHLIPMMLGCAPCLVYALLYLVKG